MIQEFIKDKSAWQKRVIGLIALIFVCIFAFLVLDSARMEMLASRNSAAAKAAQQSKWLEQFDYAENAQILETLLKPVKEEDIDIIQARQAEILRNAGLTLEKISNGDISKAKIEKRLGYVTSTADVNGSWDNLVTALNKFEKEALVVISDCKITAGKDSEVSAKISYNIYFTKGAVKNK